MIHGTYVGPNPKYRNKTALARKGKRGRVLLQFDDIENLFEKAHGWHEFLAKHFQPDEVRK